MIAWLKELLGSSVGKKLLMALSGLLLLGFLVFHLAENLLIYADRQGSAFDQYVHTLTSFAWLPRCSWCTSSRPCGSACRTAPRGALPMS
jgi:hypothetical protein